MKCLFRMIRNMIRIFHFRLRLNQINLISYWMEQQLFKHFKNSKPKCQVKVEWVVQFSLINIVLPKIDYSKVICKVIFKVIWIQHINLKWLKHLDNLPKIILELIQFLILKQIWKLFLLRIKQYHQLFQDFRKRWIFQQIRLLHQQRLNFHS